MRLVMTLKVRDEEEILDANLRYHRALGVDSFIVMDNGSVDRTPDILARYADAGLVHVLREESGNLFADGADWYTRMGRIAATELEADWVMHNDADEFWWPLTGTLKDALADIPDRFGAVVVPRAEFVGRPDAAGSFAERLVFRETRSNLQPKVAHRADPNVVVMHRGAHEVAATSSGDLWQALRPPGRAVHRSVRSEGEPTSGEEVRLIWAPRWPLRIFHFPVRSLAQFRRRTEISLRHGGFPDSGRFKRLRRAYESDRLEEFYAQLVWDDAAVAEGIAAGELVRDERIARMLPRCPDPFGGGPAGSLRVELKGDELERERTEVELDAMRLMTRTMRFTMLQLDQARQRIDELYSTSGDDLRQTIQEHDSTRRKLDRQLNRVERKNRTLRAYRKRLNRERRRRRALGEKLKAERTRPWSRLRRGLKGLRKRAGRLAGRGR